MNSSIKLLHANCRDIKLKVKQISRSVQTGTDPIKLLVGPHRSHVDSRQDMNNPEFRSIEHVESINRARRIYRIQFLIFQTAISRAVIDGF